MRTKRQSITTKKYIALILVIVSIVFAFSLSNIIKAHNTENLDQNHFWFRSDSGSESTALGYGGAAQDDNITDVPTDAQLRIRLAIDDLSSAQTNNQEYEAQWSTDAGGDCTAGTWTTINTTSVDWNLYDDSEITDQEVTTQQITSGAGTFVAGSLQDTSENTIKITFADGTDNVSEAEWSIQGNSPSAGIPYYFRVVKDGVTALQNYSACPSLTTAAASGPDITVPASVSMPDYTLGGVGYTDRNFNDVSGLVQVTAAAGFTVTVSSTNLTSTNNTISNADVRLRTDGTVISNPTVIENCTGFSGIVETTEGEYALDSAQTIVTTSSGTGTCDIYPSIRVHIDNYDMYIEEASGVLTFTVT